MSTRTSGAASRNFIIGMRLWPPAIRRAPSPYRSRSSTASPTLPATSYSNRAGTCTRLSSLSNDVGVPLFPAKGPEYMPLSGSFYSVPDPGVRRSRVDRAGSFGEASARMPGPQRDDLGRDRYRRFLGGARPDIKADGAADARELLVCYALLLQAGRTVVMCPAAPHRPDVARRRLEGLLEYRHVELGVVGQDGDDAAAVDLGCLQELIGPGYDDLVRRREAFAGGEDGAGVADDHTVAHELASPRDGRSEVYGAEDIHPWRRGERLDEDGNVLHPALAARAIVDGPRLAAFEHRPGAFHDGPLEVIVARRPGMIFWGDQDLAPERAFRSLYDCRHSHGRLLGEGRVPA